MKIKVDEFGTDHWGLLAYIQHRCASHNGILNKHEMRCNEMAHPEFNVNLQEWQPNRGTRLKGFSEDKLDTSKFLIFHDDWDCLLDLEKGGFIKILNLQKSEVKLTRKGIKELANLKQHEFNGGNFSNYQRLK